MTDSHHRATPMADTMSTAEVRDTTGLTPHEVYDLIRTGTFRTVQTAKWKRHRVTRESVDAFIAELRQRRSA